MEIKYYEDYLFSHGYTRDDKAEFFNGILTYINYYKNSKRISLQVGLKDNPSDLNNYEVETVLIESPICNKRDFVNGDDSSIILVSNPGDNTYFSHGLDLFEKCVDIQDHILEHEMFIMQCHINNLKWIQENLHQFLIDHDYILQYSSTFDTRERNNSDFVIDYHHPNELSFIFLSLNTDCITGDLIYHSKQGKQYKIKEVDNLYEFIRKNEWCDINGNLDIDFKYFEVEGWNINSSKELLIFLEDYYHKKWGNTYNLPPGYEHQYQDYLKQIPLCQNQKIC